MFYFNYEIMLGIIQLANFEKIQKHYYIIKQ